MDFPPLEDVRWDRLLGAVVAQRPTVGDPTAPLATPFPSLPTGLQPQPDDEDDETIRLDAYA